MFCVICHGEYPKCPLVASNVGLETSAPLIDGIVNNALFHSNSHINQMPPKVIHILRFSGRLDAQIL